MKQKYVVLLDNETGKLAIQEYAEPDKEILSLLCEETYDTEVIKAAMKKDRSTLIQSLRTHNMYPPGTYTERIADTIEQMFQPGASARLTSAMTMGRRAADAQCKSSCI